MHVEWNFFDAASCLIMALLLQKMHIVSIFVNASNLYFVGFVILVIVKECFATSRFQKTAMRYSDILL